MNWDSNCHDPEFRNSTGDQCFLRQMSNVTITWDIPTNQEPGEYRLAHNGGAMLVGGRLRQYTGMSSVFTVTPISEEGRSKRATSYDHQEKLGYVRPPRPELDELDEDNAWDVLYSVLLDTPW